jgi:hypothetical protein
VLPEVVLLEIFDFFVVGDQALPSFGAEHCTLLRTSRISKRMVEWWQPLVHVCRRWSGLVFRSPRRLNLQLYCTPYERVTRETLDIWPALPLIIDGDLIFSLPMDDIFFLEHSNRIRQINFNFFRIPPPLTVSEFEKVRIATQVPFPELTALTLTLNSRRLPTETVRVLVTSDSFLGGSVPRLRRLIFNGTPFPGLQKLLLSATHLVELHWNFPHYPYISPEETVTFLSALTSLERLSLRFKFKSTQSGPSQQSRPYAPPLPTRSVLPTLMVFSFNGDNKYLEDLLARIDAPRLYQMWIEFFNIFLHDFYFGTPQLIQFIGRIQTFKPPNEAHVTLNNGGARFKLQSQAPNLEIVNVDVSCTEPNWDPSGPARIRTSFSPLLSAVESLYVYENLHSPSEYLGWRNGIENTEWLEFLFPFTAVKNPTYPSNLGHVSRLLCNSSLRVE